MTKVYIKARSARASLETGVRQPEALGLYSRAGYVRRGPCGSYPDDPLSVFMEKQLTQMSPSRDREGAISPAA